MKDSRCGQVILAVMLMASVPVSAAEISDRFLAIELTGTDFIDGPFGGGICVGSAFRLGESPFRGGARLRFASSMSSSNFSRTDIGGDLDLTYDLGRRTNAYLLGGISGNSVDVDAMLDGYPVKQSGFRAGIHFGAGILIQRFLLEARYRYIQHWVDYSPSSFEITAGYIIPFAGSESPRRVEAVAPGPQRAMPPESNFATYEATSFEYQGPLESAWLADATVEVLNKQWRKAGLLASSGNTPEHLRIHGTVRVASGKIHFIAMVDLAGHVRNVVVAESDIDRPFDGWQELARRIALKP